MTDDTALEHAWRYFALHAAQRMTVFNFFVVLAGVLCTGIAAAIQSTTGMTLLAAPLGLLLALLAFVFWKLDQRTAFLVKHAEDMICRLEPPGAALMASETAKMAAAIRDERLWTYGRCLRLLFAIMAIVGIGGAVAAVLVTTATIDIARPATGDSKKAGR